MSDQPSSLRRLFSISQSFFTQRRIFITVAILTGILILFGVVYRMSYLHSTKGYVWADWTGFGDYSGALARDQRGKTLWDWLELLVIPAVLAIAALFFNRQQRKNELRIAIKNRRSDLKIAEERRKSDLAIEDERRKSDLAISEERNQEAVLQNFFDKMNDLIIEKGLMEVGRLREQAIIQAHSEGNPEPNEAANGIVLPNGLQATWDMARIRTVTALRQLDTPRRNIIFQFLRDASLASFVLVNASLIKVNLVGTLMDDINLKGTRISDAKLTNARLVMADLSGSDLSGTDLSGTNLTGANLSGAVLIRANLNGAVLYKADLTGAVFIEANLCKAVLTEALLTGTVFSEVDLSEIKGITNKQLSQYP